jgi:hypothetical protein
VRLLLVNLFPSLVLAIAMSVEACQISTRFVVVLEDDESATCFWRADSEHIHCCTTGAMFYFAGFFSSFYDSSFFLLEATDMTVFGSCHYD